MSPEPAAPAKPDSSPTTAFILSLVGLCCFPLGLAGGVLGYVAFAKARREGRPTPALAVGAMVLAVVAVLITFAFTVVSIRANAEREKEAAALRSSLTGKLDAEALPPDVACDLAKEYLLGVNKKQVRDVKCTGSFTQGPVSRLSKVEYSEAAEQKAQTFCLARAHRWYVLATPADGVCPVEAPAAPAAKPPDEDGLVEQEDALRKQAVELRAQALLDRFDAQAEMARVAVEQPHQKKRCPAWPSTVKAGHVDYDLLPGAQGDQKPWPLLSDADARAALDRKGPKTSRAAAVDRLYEKSHFLAVFQSGEAKTLPVATGDSFVMGEFSGWLSLVDLKTGTVVCDAPVSFRSSEKVGGGVRLKVAPKKSTQRLCDDDFEDAFKSAGSRAAAEMSGGKLKLGLKLLE